MRGGDWFCWCRRDLHFKQQGIKILQHTCPFSILWGRSSSLPETLKKVFPSQKNKKKKRNLYHIRFKRTDLRYKEKVRKEKDVTVVKQYI